MVLKTSHRKILIYTLQVASPSVMPVLIGYEISTLRGPIFDEVAIFGFMASLACEYCKMAVYQGCTLINGPKLGLKVVTS